MVVLLFNQRAGITPVVTVTQQWVAVEGTQCDTGVVEQELWRDCSLDVVLAQFSFKAIPVSNTE